MGNPFAFWALFESKKTNLRAKTWMYIDFEQFLDKVSNIHYNIFY